MGQATPRVEKARTWQVGNGTKGGLCQHPMQAMIELIPNSD